MVSYRIGIDTGGTFTDCVAVDDASGTVVVTKVLSTPEDPSIAAARGVRQLMSEHGLELADVTAFIHGTTVATNAVLEGRIARVGVLCTEGFRDVLEIGTGHRSELYDLATQKPRPLVARPLRHGIAERTASDGTVLTPPNRDDLVAAVEALVEADVDAVAICFLFSYVNSANEQAAADQVRAVIGDRYLCTSAGVRPEYREYERWSTTVINAAVAPIVSAYLQQLDQTMHDTGLRTEIHVMSSSGGVLTSREARGLAAHELLLSGPAAGVVGAARAGASAGYQNLITMDMGGTSTDVSVVIDGEPRSTTSIDVDGYPLLGTVTDIHTIGAGGGSIAWVDDGGMLHVGPRSAGAVPGPACYGRGGTSPTVTDANLVLGRVRPEGFLNGQMTVSVEAAEAALAPLAERLGLSVLEAANGIIDLANSDMQGAIRVMTTMRGLDPREFSLVAYGGAGALHAASIAEDMRIPTVIIPQYCGLQSAVGLLESDIKRESSVTHIVSAAAQAAATIMGVFVDLEAREPAEQVDLDPDGETSVARSIDARYAGQSYWITVPFASGPVTPTSIAAAVQRFHEEHERVWGQCAPEQDVEFVNFRVLTTQRLAHRKQSALPLISSRVEEACVSEEAVYFREADGFVKTPLYQRSRLGPGSSFEGPAIVMQMDATVVILPGQHANVDEYGNIVITTQIGRSA